MGYGDLGVFGNAVLPMSFAVNKREGTEDGFSTSIG
jgi:hypothetical protein